MSDKPKYGKIHTVESYYNGELLSTTKEIELQHKTSKRNYLADIMDITSPLLTGKCVEMTLTITSKNNEPYVISVRQKVSNINKFKNAPKKRYY